MLTTRYIAAPLVVCFSTSVWLAGCGPKAEEPDVVVNAPSKNTIKIENTVEVPVANKATNVVVVQPPAKQSSTTVKTTTTHQSTTNKPPVVAPTSKPPLPAPAPPTKTSAKSNPPASWKPVPPPGPRPGSTPRRLAQAPAPVKKVIPKPASGSVSSGSATSAVPLIVRSQIVSVSKIPDINNAPYQEALLFVKYKVLAVEKGDYKEKELVVAHWGMQKKKLLPASKYKVGDTQRLELVPLNDRPELERIMKWDTLNEFELLPYFANKVG